MWYKVLTNTFLSYFLSSHMVLVILPSPYLYQTPIEINIKKRPVVSAQDKADPSSLLDFRHHIQPAFHLLFPHTLDSSPFERDCHQGYRQRTGPT